MTSHDIEAGDSRLRVRAPRFDFSNTPRYWFSGMASATHFLNSLNLLLPSGERFVIRSVKHYLDRIDDEQLRASVRGFFGQEGRHANAHEKFCAVLRKQGVEIDGFLKSYGSAISVLEKVSPALLRLSVTSAIEHFTAIVAEDVLQSGVLRHADPAMCRLWEWHAIEELEHKAVAFDVLAHVSPSYALRLAGLVIASAWFGGFAVLAMRHLARQDGLTFREGKRQLRELRKDGRLLPDSIWKRVFARGIREYARREFHPNDKDHRGLVAEALARLEGDAAPGEPTRD